MFEKILLATTSSPTCKEASNVAFELAKKHGSKLYIFHALGFPTRGFGSFIVDFQTGEHEYYSPESIGKVKEEIEQTFAEELKGLDNCLKLRFLYIEDTLIDKSSKKVIKYLEKFDLILY